MKNFLSTNRTAKIISTFVVIASLGSACAKFEYDYEGEDLLVQRYQSYLTGLNEQGISFLPPEKEDSKVATLNYYSMDENWDASKVSYDSLESQLEQVVADGEEILETKTGTFYEYRSKKMKEPGFLPVEQIETQVNAAKELLETLRSQADLAKTNQILEEKSIQDTFGMISEIESDLKDKGIVFETELSKDEKRKLNSSELRGYVKYRIKAREAKKAILPGNLEEVLADPANPKSAKKLVFKSTADLNQIRADLENFGKKFRFTVNFLRKTIFENIEANSQFPHFVNSVMLDQMMLNFVGPHATPMDQPQDVTMIKLKNELIKQKIYPASEQDPINALSQDLLQVELATNDGVQFPSRLVLKYVCALIIVEAKYQLKDQEGDYYLLVRGGARRIRAKQQAILKFFRSGSLLEMVPEKP